MLKLRLRPNQGIEFAFGAALALAFCPWLVYPADTGKWLVLAGFALWGGLSAGKPGLPLALVIVLLGWCGAGLGWSEAPLGWVDWGWRVVALIGVAQWGASRQSLDWVWLGLGLGLLAQAPLVLAQLAGHDLAHSVNVPAGLFGNRNCLGEVAALAACGCALRRPKLALALVGLVLLTRCRAAEGGLVLALVVWLWGTREFRLVSVALGMGLALVLALAYFDQDTSLLQRVHVWQDLLPALDWRGHGLGSFYSQAPRWISEASTQERFIHAHSEFVELWFELGIGSLLVWGLWALAWRKGDVSSKMVLACASVLCALAFPLHLASDAGLLACVLGWSLGRSPSPGQGRVEYSSGPGGLDLGRGGAGPGGRGNQVVSV